MADSPYGDEDNYLDLAKPGTIATLKSQALTFGTCESSQMIYYSDPEKKNFKEIFLSD